MWDSLKRTLEAWGHLNDLVALLDLLGWRQAVWGLVGAALVWLSTWLANWWLPYALLAAVATFFVVAVGVALIRARRTPATVERAASVTLSEDVVSITDFLRRAEQRRWRFTEPPTSQAIEICRHLREDARNNRLTFYGIEARWQSSELLRNEVLEPIPAEHWRDFRIDCIACFDIASPAGTISRVTSDNWRTETYTNRHQNKAHRFVNLHLDRRQAERWLSRVAPAESAGTVPKSTWPDFDKWDKQEEFRLFEAACLWCDETPALPMSGAARTVFEELREAIYDGDLTASLSIEEAARAAWGKHVERAPPEDDPIDVNTTVKRKWLVDYAKRTGQRPRFLFPAARAA